MIGKKQVIKHLKSDIKTFKKEAHEDKGLMKSLKHKKKKHTAKKVVKKAHKEHHKGMPKAKAKVKLVMHEFKEHKLHSGSKKGPVVHNPKQAIAIALSESRKVTKNKRK